MMTVLFIAFALAFVSSLLLVYVNFPRTNSSVREAAAKVPGSFSKVASN